MKAVDQARLDSDSHYRYDFLAGFIGFGEEEIQTLHEIAPHMVKVLPKLVDRVYEKMFDYDITKRQFVPRHAGYEGPHATDLEQLSLEDGQVQFRKRRLIDYFTTLLTAEFDETTADYLDAVGKMHTTKGGSASLHTPLMLVNIMLGYIQDLFAQDLLNQEDLDPVRRWQALRALQKLFWIQQSFVSQHY